MIITDEEYKFQTDKFCKKLYSGIKNLKFTLKLPEFRHTGLWHTQQEITDGINIAYKIMLRLGINLELFGSEGLRDIVYKNYVLYFKKVTNKIPKGVLSITVRHDKELNE